MVRYLVIRLIQFVPTVFIATILVFILLMLAPGDPASMFLGSEATPEMIANQRALMGLDDPAPLRYVRWLTNALHGDLGESYVTRKTVLETVAYAFPRTLKLSLTAMIIGTLGGLFLGIAAAVRQNSTVDIVVTTFGSIGLSIPSFWLGIMLILLFSVRLHWLPPGGADDVGGSSFYNPRYLLMPTLSLAFGLTLMLSRFVRTTFVDVLASDYIRTARAKGLAERTTLLRHALRNAMIPLITVWGMAFAGLLSGAVITESVFSYPGLGRTMVGAIASRDYPVVQGGLLFVVLIFVLVNLLIDLSYGILDPRVRLDRTRGS